MCAVLCYTNRAVLNAWNDCLSFPTLESLFVNSCTYAGKGCSTFLQCNNLLLSLFYGKSRSGSLLSALCLVWINQNHLSSHTNQLCHEASGRVSPHLKFRWVPHSDHLSTFRVILYRIESFFFDLHDQWRSYGGFRVIIDRSIHPVLASWIFPSHTLKRIYGSTSSITVWKQAALFSYSTVRPRITRFLLF